MSEKILSWGRAHRLKHTLIRAGRTACLDQLIHGAQMGEYLPHGRGRSYGDVALNGDRSLILMSDRDLICEADWQSGKVRAGAGLTLRTLNAIARRQGWQSPVLPGTADVTLGGCVANDVHDKTVGEFGSFGAHVLRLRLIRSDGFASIISRQNETDLFEHTLGGLGLTGIIDWVEVQLARDHGAGLNVERRAVPCLDAHFELFEDGEDWTHAVSWVDALASGKATGRGIFERARPSSGQILERKIGRDAVGVPELPLCLIGGRTGTRGLNWLYRHMRSGGIQSRIQPDGFHHPLDGLEDWNRLYGRRGLVQYQALLPLETARESARDMLQIAARSAVAPTLAVLKHHGRNRSPAKLRFADEGVSLAMDFANQDGRLDAVLGALDDIVHRAGGRLYPAKDGRMSAAQFQAGYPHWRALEELRDPGISSSFWRRVSGVAA